MRLRLSKKFCSVSGGTLLQRSIGKVTKFPYQKLKANVDAMCAIDDALNSYVGNVLRVKDIDHLCSACKYIICHRVSLSEFTVHANCRDCS